MQVAHIRDKRAFIHDANEPNSRVLDQVRRFYKGVAVSVRPSGMRKKITGLVQAAGRQLFTKDGAQITVAVSHLSSNRTPLWRALLPVFLCSTMNRYVVVQEYWAEHHHIMLQYPDAFGVQVGYSDAIFPAEVCEIVTGQRYKKKLSPEDTATFISQTKAKPNEKLRDIMSAVNGRVRTLFVRGRGFVLRNVKCPATRLHPVSMDGGCRFTSICTAYRGEFSYTTGSYD